MPEQIPSTRQYSLGWEHGYQAAMESQPHVAPEPTRATVVLAGGVFVVGVGTAAAAALYQTNHPLREVFGVFAVAGILLNSTLGAMRVLKGEPTPQLGIQV